MNRRGRLFRVVSAVAVTAAFAAASGASAATPRQIYKDFADNGRLDRQYTRADLERALHSAVLGGYGNRNVTSRLKPTIRQKLAQPRGAGLQTTGRGGLPFTGLDIAYLVGGGLLLIGTGFGLRRLERVKSKS
jgi:hypothetical protein